MRQTSFVLPRSGAPTLQHYRFETDRIRNDSAVQYLSGGGVNPIDAIIAQLEQQRESIEQALNALRMVGGSSERGATAPKVGGGKRTLSPAGRRRIAEAARRRWAEKRAGQAAAQPAAKKTGSAPRRRLTPAGRKRLAQAMRRRWAVKRASAAKRAS